MKESLRGEISQIKKEEFSSDSNSFINVLKNMISSESNKEEEKMLSSSLIPAVINNLVEQVSTKH